MDQGIVRIEGLPRYARVPEWVIDHSGLSDRAVRVFAVLARYGDKPFPSHKTIAERIGCSVSSVQRALAELAEHGAVKVERRQRKDGGWMSNGYVLYMTPQSPVTEGGQSPVTGAPQSGVTDERKPNRTKAIDTDVSIAPGPITETKPLPLTGEVMTQPVRAGEGRNSPVRAKPEALRQRAFEVICEACGYALDSLTSSERGRVNRAIKELTAVSVTIRELTEFPHWYKRTYRDAELTPQAYPNNFSAFRRDRKGRAESQPHYRQVYDPEVD